MVKTSVDETESLDSIALQGSSLDSGNRLRNTNLSSSGSCKELSAIIAGRASPETSGTSSAPHKSPAGVDGLASQLDHEDLGASSSAKGKQSSSDRRLRQKKISREQEQQQGQISSSELQAPPTVAAGRLPAASPAASPVAKPALFPQELPDRLNLGPIYNAEARLRCGAFSAPQSVSPPNPSDQSGDDSDFREPPHLLRVKQGIIEDLTKRGRSNSCSSTDLLRQRQLHRDNQALRKEVKILTAELKRFKGKKESEVGFDSQGGGS